MISSYTSWQPLEEVIVGNCYPGDYFDYLPNKKVSDQLKKILDETEEDLDYLSHVCQQFGATVQRPDIMSKDQFQEHQINHGEATMPPLTPRDWQISMGDKLLVTTPMEEMHTIINQYEKDNPGSVIDPFDRKWNPDVLMNGAVASCVVRVGTDVFFDNSDWWTPEQTEWVRQNVLDDRYTIHEARTEGHGDAVFAILKPGVILSTYHADDLDLDSEFPGWDILRVGTSNLQEALALGKFKEENFNGQWYVQGTKPTDEFSHYVDKYLKNWTGEAEETVFDVNCLVLDESHVIMSSTKPEIETFLKKHNIEPIVVPLRHRYFWDGGISCCTQDIRRKGGLESYL